MKIELLHLPGCPRCAASARQLRDVAAGILGDALHWSELDVMQHIDYAVSLGIVCPPVLVIDGELAFASLPGPRTLTLELTRRLQGAGRSAP